MITPDTKYIPKAKGKNKAIKTKAASKASTFPPVLRKPEVKALKKKSPKGDHYVWSK